MDSIVSLRRKSVMRARLMRAAVGAIVLGIAGALFPAVATADVGLITNHQRATSGRSFTVYGTACGMPIYLIAQPAARKLGVGVAYPAYPVVPKPPAAKPFILLGRMRCGTEAHYVGDYPHGDYSGWLGVFSFKVPTLPTGLYDLVIYCNSCRPGHGGTLIVNVAMAKGEANRSDRASTYP